MDILDPSLSGLLWVIAIGLTVIVIDVFFETEILSVAALLGISIYLTLLFDVALKWRVLLGFSSWLTVTALFYLVWKRFVAPLMRKGIAGGIDESSLSATGATGEYRLIDGKAFVYWNGDLWPLKREQDNEAGNSGRDGFQDRDLVIIETMENGLATISPASDQ